VRRYCAANGLNRLGTLTYRGDGLHDPLQLRRDVAQFFRNLRAALDGSAFAYAWVPEWHKSGHGLHVHFAVGRYIPRSTIDAAWGHGFVHIKLLSNLPVGSGRWEEARLAARYLSKYVAKSFDEGAAIPGLHRYEVGQGFQPTFQRIKGSSRADVLRRAVDRVGSMPNHFWTSDSVPEWQGPPALWVAW
jgi:hypothetical protein